MKFLPMEEFQKRQKSIDPSSKALADTYLKKLANIAGHSNTNVRHLMAPVLDTQEKVENYRTIRNYQTTYKFLIGNKKFLAKTNSSRNQSHHHVRRRRSQIRKSPNKRKSKKCNQFAWILTAPELPGTDNKLVLKHHARFEK